MRTEPGFVRPKRDSKPYAPNAGGLTPYELAEKRGELGLWLIARYPVRLDQRRSAQTKWQKYYSRVR